MDAADSFCANACYTVLVQQSQEHWPPIACRVGAGPAKRTRASVYREVCSALCRCRAHATAMRKQQPSAYAYRFSARFCSGVAVLRMESADNLAISRQDRRLAAL
jgi:hypothetical protein